MSIIDYLRSKEKHNIADEIVCGGLDNALPDLTSSDKGPDCKTENSPVRSIEDIKDQESEIKKMPNELVKSVLENALSYLNEGLDTKAENSLVKSIEDIEDQELDIEKMSKEFVKTFLEKALSYLNEGSDTKTERSADKSIENIEYQVLESEKMSDGFVKSVLVNALSYLNESQDTKAESSKVKSIEDIEFQEIEIEKMSKEFVKTVIKKTNLSRLNEDQDTKIENREVGSIEDIEDQESELEKMSNELVEDFSEKVAISVQNGGVDNNTENSKTLIDDIKEEAEVQKMENEFVDDVLDNTFTDAIVLRGTEDIGEILEPSTLAQAVVADHSLEEVSFDEETLESKKIARENVNDVLDNALTRVVIVHDTQTQKVNVNCSENTEVQAGSQFDPSCTNEIRDTKLEDGVGTSSKETEESKLDSQKISEGIVHSELENAPAKVTLLISQVVQS